MTYQFAEKLDNTVKSNRKPQDASAILIKALAEIGVTAEIKGLIHGPRVSAQASSTPTPRS
ncbi:hypothetical protein LP416_11010 [Polaromonas sp. P2-4]|nr:hypothetical protein LP416_11010 [Polaromonas sp. P2-4]